MKWFSKNKFITFVAVSLFSFSSVFGMELISPTLMRLQGPLAEFVADAAGYLGVVESAANLIEGCATIRSEGGNMVRITPESVALSRTLSDGKNVTLRIEYSPHGYKSHTIFLDDSRDLLVRETGVTTRSTSVGVTYAPGKKPAKDDRKKVDAAGSVQATSLSKKLVAAFYESKKSSVQLVALNQPVGLKSTPKAAKKPLESLLLAIQAQPTTSYGDISPEMVRAQVATLPKVFTTEAHIAAGSARVTARTGSEELAQESQRIKDIAGASCLLTDMRDVPREGEIRDLFLATRLLGNYIQDKKIKKKLSPEWIQSAKITQVSGQQKKLEYEFSQKGIVAIKKLAAEEARVKYPGVEIKEADISEKDISFGAQGIWYKFTPDFIQVHEEADAFVDGIKSQASRRKLTPEEKRAEVLAQELFADIDPKEIVAPEKMANKKRGKKKRASKQQASATTGGAAGTGGVQPPTGGPNGPKKPIKINEKRIRDKKPGGTHDHIHKKKHLWDQTGLNPDEIDNNLIEILKKAASEGKLSWDGLFDIHSTINGHPITISGNVVNGIAHPSTAFVVSQTQSLAVAAWNAAQAAGKLVLGLGAAAATGEASAAAPAGRAAKTSGKTGQDDEKESKKVRGARLSAAADDDAPASVAHVEPDIASLRSLTGETKRETKGAARGKPAAAAFITPAAAGSAEDIAAGVAPIGVVNRKITGAMRGGESITRRTRKDHEMSSYSQQNPFHKVVYNEDFDDNVHLARKLAKKSPRTWSEGEQEFAKEHQSLMRKELAKIGGHGESVAQSGRSPSDGKQSDRGHQGRDSRSDSRGDVQPVDESEDDGEVYDEEAIAEEILRIQKLSSYSRTRQDNQFLIDHQDVVKKLEEEKNRRLEAEVNADRKAKDDLFDAKIGIDNLERIHRIAPEKRSASDTAQYNRSVPHISSFIKTFNKKLKKDLKTALKKSPKERDKDEKELIESHPDKITEIQEEELEKEKLLKEQEKTYAKATKQSMQAAALTRLMKDYNTQEAHYKEQIDEIWEDMWNRKLLNIQTMELYKLSCQAREAKEKKRSFFANRGGAISRTLDNPNVSGAWKYTIENIPSVYKDIINRFIRVTVSEAQKCVHDELVASIGKNNTFYKEQYLDAEEINENRHVVNISAFVYHFADIARQYNEAGKIEQAFALTDFCSQLVAVENAYVVFVTEHQHCFFARLFTLGKTVDPLIEFGKKLNGYVRNYKTEDISSAMARASTELSRALALTSNDQAVFSKKILAEGQALIAAINEQEDNVQERLITFIAKRFLHGSALGLKSSDETKAMLKVLGATINAEQTILAQADEIEENRQMLSPITTIFKQAVEKAIKIAAAAAADDKESKIPKKIAKPKVKKPVVEGQKSPPGQTVKRKRTIAAKKTKPTTATGTNDKTGATAVDEAEDGEEVDDLDTDESEEEHLRKRRRCTATVDEGDDVKKAKEVKDPRLKSCLQQNDPDLKKYNQNHGLHCGYYAFAHAWRWLEKRSTDGNETRIWLRDKLRSSIRPGLWESIVFQQRFPDALWGREAYPGRVNNLTSDDLELIVRHELKNFICSPGFKTELRRARITLELHERDAMALAQVARNGFADVDAAVQARLNTVLGGNKNIIYNLVKQNALCNILIIDSITQLRDICFGQGLTPLIAGSVDLYRDFKIPQAMVINIGADRGDARAVTHWISWSRDEQGAHAIFDSLYNSPKLSARHEECCRLLDKLSGQTSARLNHKAEVITKLQSARTRSLQAESTSQQYRDNLFSFLENLVTECMKTRAVATAVNAEIKAVKVRKAAHRDVKISVLAQGCAMTVLKRTAGNLVSAKLDPAVLIKNISDAYPAAYRNVLDTGRAWDLATLRERAQVLFDEAHTYAMRNLGEEDYQEIVDFLGYRDFSAAMLSKTPLSTRTLRSSSKIG